MTIKVGYYPMLDAALCIRQIFSVERFKPYSAPLQAVDLRLSEEQKNSINSIAAFTQDWLDVIENLIDMTMGGISSPEEVYIEAVNKPQCIFGPR